MDVDRSGYSGKDPYSHSIVNEPSKLLIGTALDAASKIVSVILTVNLSGTSIGEGFRLVRPKLTFRDLSTSIDSHDACGRRRRAPVSLRQTPKKSGHQAPYAIVTTHCFARDFAVSSRRERCRPSALRIGHRRPTLSARWSILGVLDEPAVAGGRGNSAATVATYAGDASRGDTLRAMSSRAAKVFRS